MAQAAFPITSYVQLINLKATGATVVVPARNARFIVTGAKCIAATKTGSGDAPTFSIGQSASFDNVIAAAASLGAVNDQEDIFAQIAVLPTTVPALDLNGNSIRVNVTDVGDYSPHTAYIVVEGYWLS
jgi:hypothetical protein